MSYHGYNETQSFNDYSQSSDAYGYGDDYETVQPTVTLVKCVTAFNSRLKKLANKLATTYPNDPKIERAKKRIMLGVDYDPVGMLDTVGPALYMYKDDILDTENDDSFFVNNNFSSEIDSSTDAEKADMATYIIPKIQESWKAASDDDKAGYLKTVRDLFYDYADYLSLHVKG